MMRSMGHSRRGVLYTLGLTLFVLALLGVSILLFRQGQVTQERFAELGGREKVSNVEHSINDAFAELLARKVGLRTSSTLNSVTFNTTFPQNWSNVDPFFSMIQTNAERDFSFVTIDVGQFAESPELIFEPSSVHYVQETPTQAIISGGDDDEEGEGGDLSSVRGYNISVLFSANITSCITHVDTGGSLQMTVSATSPFGSCQVPATASVKELTVDMVSEGRNVRVQVDEEKELLLRSEVPLHSSITVLLQPLSEYGQIEIPIKLTLNESALSYYKSSRVIIHSLS